MHTGDAPGRQLSPSRPDTQQAPTPSLAWSDADAAQLGPSRITITRFYQRAPKPPYHRLDSLFKMPNRPPPSPGPKKKRRCVSFDSGPQPDIWSDADADADADADVEDNQRPLVPLAPPPRFSSAPPEARPKPRVSDDTAILHAFLAKANKRSMPVAKRESLENRRDSDVVRQALASTEGAHVLADLDANSPLRPGSASPEQEAGADQDQGRQPEQARVPADAQAVQEGPASSKSKPRRTLRVRNKRLASPVKPAKITIRTAADQVALKRTEAQELSLATRTNTRKNKGKAVMPAVRLQKLAAEGEQEGEEEAPTVAPTAQDPKGAKLKWDDTLVYYREASPEVEDAPSPRAARAIRRSKPALAVPPPTPAAEEAPDQQPPAEQQQQQQTQPPKPTPTAAATKRKSRIATPARPSKPSIPTTSATTTTTTTTAAAAAAAPQKLFQPPTSSDPDLATTTTTTTPKKSSAQGLGAAKPPQPHAAFAKPDFKPKPADASAAPTTSTSTSTSTPTPTQAQTSNIPGLSSPAKRKVRSAFGARAPRFPVQRQSSAAGAGVGVGVGGGGGGVPGSELPGLTSPAKRKRPGGGIRMA